jgi:hypothetical protein
MNKNEYMKITNNLNRLRYSKLITESEYIQACALLDKKYSASQKEK